MGELPFIQLLWHSLVLSYVNFFLDCYAQVLVVQQLINRPGRKELEQLAWLLYFFPLIRQSDSPLNILVLN